MAVNDIDRKQAMLWLHDRFDRRVEIDMRVTWGDSTFSVLSAIGQLKHWTHDLPSPPEGAVGEMLRHKLIGSYEIGNAHLDISDERVPLTFSLDDGVLVMGIDGEPEVLISVQPVFGDAV